jgi:UDP-glucose 4-epimerase
MMKVLVTGGAGYIGSHTCVELLNAGHEVIVVDNLVNSKEESLKRVQEITGKTLKFYKLDLLDKEALKNVFETEKIDAVIHFAGLKAVGESVKVPLLYYHNNLLSTIHLLEIMNEFEVKTLVFSSSATVYGEPKSVPIAEDFPLHATNPYGRTKLMLEEILNDVYVSDNTLSITLLRYFNPVGAHESGKIGEDPKGTPNNLMPYISQVAVGKLPKLSIFGGDWPTPDGTGVRDYIHVVDLAKGHVAALDKMNGKSGVHTFNLGTGKGVSVLELVKAFENATGKQIPYEIVARREGDIPQCYADCSKAQKELDWSTTRTLDDMCKDSWHWQSENPTGY